MGVARSQRSLAQIWLGLPPAVGGHVGPSVGHRPDGCVENGDAATAGEDFNALPRVVADGLTARAHGSREVQRARKRLRDAVPPAVEEDLGHFLVPSERRAQRGPSGQGQYEI